MKIMGMDIGEKRVGIALSDDEKRLSIPHSIISNNKDFTSKLTRILDRESIEKIIVGMPYTLKGEIGSQGKKVLDFVKNNILNMGMEVVYQDERFTSKFPADASLNKKKMKHQKDKFSAALILQSYLDRKSKIKKVEDEK
jgi:putative Holliday junction resolvase